MKKGLLFAGLVILGVGLTSTVHSRTATQHSKNVVLFEAVKHDNLTGVHDALKSGANVNARDDDDNTPLILAVKKNKLDIVNALLKTPSIDINRKNHEGKTALSYAQKGGLIQKSIQKTQYSKDGALFEAVKRANVAGINDALKNGADVNARDHGNTPLILAVKENKLNIVKALLKAPGIDVNRKKQAR